jgi:hypothetical protein
MLFEDLSPNLTKTFYFKLATDRRTDLALNGKSGRAVNIDCHTQNRDLLLSKCGCLNGKALAGFYVSVFTKGRKTVKHPNVSHFQSVTAEVSWTDKPGD